LAEAVPLAVATDDAAAKRFSAFVENQLCAPLGLIS